MADEAINPLEQARANLLAEKVALETNMPVIDEPTEAPEPIVDPEQPGENLDTAIEQPTVSETPKLDPKAKRFNENFWKANEYERMKPVYEDLIRSNEVLRKEVEGIKQAKEQEKIEAQQNKMTDLMRNGQFDEYNQANIQYQQMLANKQQVIAPVQQNQIDYDAQAFVARNPWFNQDVVLRERAIAIENQVRNNPQFSGRPNAQVYGEVERVMKEVYLNPAPVARYGAVDGSASNQPRAPQKPTGYQTLTQQEKDTAKWAYRGMDEESAYKAYYNAKVKK